MNAGLNIATTFFSEIITAYNVTITIVDGRDVRNTGADYPIYGSINPGNDKDIKLDYDGAISEGIFILYTSNTIYAADLNDENVVNNIQTFIKYSNEIWKLRGVANWMHTLGNVKKYILSKYTEI